MESVLQIEEKFYKSCFSLSEDDIFKLEKNDNGPLNNVIANIRQNCFGVKLYDDSKGLAADMFYVTNRPKLQGDIIHLDLNEPDYFHLLIKFCHLLVVSYEELDTINCFNNFQSMLRTFLEKSGFFTVTTIELKRFDGQNAVMMSNYPRGIRKIEIIDKIDFYRDFFNQNYKKSELTSGNFVYLMVNTDTSLIKIGFSNDPRYRERTLHSKEPSVYLIACWQSDKKRENELHKKYSHKRIRGEWFRLNFADLQELEKLMS